MSSNAASIPGFVASHRPSTHLHPANGLFGRIIGPRHPLLPVKHPITGPVLTHADENVAQLLQGRMLSTLSNSLFRNLLPQFKQTPTAFRGQLSEQPFDFVQQILVARNRSVAKASDALLSARLIPGVLLVVFLVLTRDPLIQGSLLAFPVQVVISVGISMMVLGYLLIRSIVSEAVCAL
jgi:hypothetical protein